MEPRKIRSLSNYVAFISFSIGPRTAYAELVPITATPILSCHVIMERKILSLISGKSHYDYVQNKDIRKRCGVTPIIE